MSSDVVDQQRTIPPPITEGSSPSPPTSGDGTKSRQRQHILELDGVRGIAVLLVLVSHLRLPKLWGIVGMGWGHHGVDLFFVLSGFLITRIRLYEQEQHISLREFWIKRITRIFPAAYLCLAVVAIFWGMSWHIVAAGAYVINWDLPLLSGEVTAPIGHYWSLAVEEQFYLFWPLVLLLPLSISRKAAVTLCCMFAVFYTLTGVLEIRFGEDATISKLLSHQVFTRGWPLLLGGLLAMYEPDLRRSPQRLLVISLTTGMFGVAVRAIALVLDRQGILTSKVLGWQGMQLVMISFFCLSLWISMRGISTPLRWGSLRWVGAISYGIYLYHLPIYFAVDAFSSPSRSFLAVTATFCVAAASYSLFENPIIQWGRRVATSMRKPRTADEGKAASLPQTTCE